MRKIQLLSLLVAAFSLLPKAHSQGDKWYKSFAVTIGKYPATIHLSRTETDYRGFYYYERLQQPIPLNGQIAEDGQRVIKLYATLLDRNQAQEVFELYQIGDSLSGTWKQTETSAALPVNGKEKKEFSLSFDLVVTEGVEKLRPEQSTSPEANYRVATIWPRQNTATANFIKRKVIEIFGGNNSDREINTLLLANRKKFMTSYFEDFKEVADSDLVNFPSGYNMDDQQLLQVLYQSNKILTLAHWNYSYTGGAHGNYGTGYSSINLLSNKYIQLKDVLNPAGIKQLNKLLEKNFRKQYGVKPGESLSDAGLLEETIAANDNFYLTKKGIGFGYVPYEIGPYAMGEVNIFIPFSELTTYLQAGFKKLIQ